MKRALSFVLLLALLGPAVPLSAQEPAGNMIASTDYWRKYAEKLQIGSTVKVRIADGKRITAVLAIVDESGITVQPKARVPEPPRLIPFDQLRQIENQEHGGLSVGKAVAIGAGVGGGIFLGLLAVLAASWD